MTTLLKLSGAEFLALARTQKANKQAPADTLSETDDQPDPMGVLADLPLLPDDRRFIVRETRYLSLEVQNRVLAWYRRIFIRSMAREKNLIRKENVGRRHANNFLRRYATRLAKRAAVAG